MKLKSTTRHEQWFDIPGESGAVLIRDLTPGDMAEIKDTVFMFGDISAPSSSKAELRREYMSRHIADWKGIEDEDGKPLPPTYANKLLLMEQPLPGIKDEDPKTMSDFLWTCIGTVRSGAEKLRGEAEKN